jgi:hypothetical protein
MEAARICGWTPRKAAVAASTDWSARRRSMIVSQPKVGRLRR